MKRLECAVQNYGWGKPASESMVAKLISPQFVDPTKPYAELWMGTHPNGPSKVFDDNMSLSDYIKAHPESMGKHESDGLKFIFKILSVGKGLSVQSHPTKEQAKELHSKDPKNYPDDNHKPEMAVALSRFEVLCGFRVHHEIISNFKAHSELLELVNEEDLSKLAVEHSDGVNKSALKALFSSIWKSPQSKITKVVQNILDRISKKDDRPDVENLMLRLNTQYPGGDVGVLAPLFLNHFTLEPSEAIFLGPNEPHAYLSGDCVECMARSDNTIRAGLTPKFKDVENLCENLTYKMTPAPYFKSTQKSTGILEYAPPVEEFVVERIDNSAKELTCVQASSIIIIVSGSSAFTTTIAENTTKTETTAGNVWFVPCGAKLALEGSSSDFLAFRAFTPPKN